MLFKYLVGEIEIKEVETVEEGEEDLGKDKKKKKKKGKKKGGGGGGSEITLMPTLFPEAYYNGQVKAPRHAEDVLEMNSLLGGTCVCVCVFTLIYIYVYMYVYILMCVYIHIYVYEYMYMLLNI